MSTERPEVDPAEIAAADRLDADISALLAGAPGEPGALDPELVRLANAIRVDVPARAHAAVERRLRARSRRWSIAQVAAVLLGLIVVIHGAANIVAGDWISRSLGEPFNEHALVDGGIAFIMLGVGIAVAGSRRRWLPVALAIGVPLGLIMGGRGLHEVGTFAWGAVAHGAVGLGAIVLLVTYVIAWRYGRRDRGEGEV